MYSLVILQVRGCTECLVTALTLVVLFSSVDSAVNDQAVFALKVLATELTLVLSVKKNKKLTITDDDDNTTASKNNNDAD